MLHAHMARRPQANALLACKRTLKGLRQKVVGVVEGGGKGLSKLAWTTSGSSFTSFAAQLLNI